MLEQPLFSAFLTGLMMSHFVIYLFFYLVMKIRKDGRVDLLVWFYSLLTLLSVVASLVFLSMPTSNHDLNPAASREMNHECILFEFYDFHDIWHFLSAFALFFASVTLLVVDDDLNDIPRHHILVF